MADDNQVAVRFGADTSNLESGIRRAARFNEARAKNAGKTFSILPPTFMVGFASMRPAQRTRERPP